jgi:hypothetical protein
MKKKIFILLFIAVAGFVAASAQPAVMIGDKPGWHKIAERHVSYKADHDEIMVVGNDHFKQIKLKVEDNSISLVNFQVYYEGETMQTIEVNKVLNKGEETTAADIDPNKAIRKIVLDYKTIGITGMDVTKDSRVNTGSDKEHEVERETETEKERAEVEIWGLK